MPLGPEISTRVGRTGGARGRLTIAVTVSSSTRNPLPVSVTLGAKRSSESGSGVIRQMVRRNRLGTRWAVHSMSSRWSVLGKKSGAVTSE